MTHKFLCIIVAVFISWNASAANERIPQFSGVSLSGQKVTRAQLLKEPSVLIVTPTRDAASETRQWAKYLQAELEETPAHDIIALDLPFFISEKDAAERAKKMIPKEFWKQTWILNGSNFEEAIGIPKDANEAYVFAVSSDGELLLRVSGKPSKDKVERIKSTLLAATPAANP